MLANNYRRATATYTSLGVINVDASLTGSVAWIGELAGGGELRITASMPQDGLSLDLYIRHTATMGNPILRFCGSLSSNGSSPFLVSGSNNTSAARTSIILAAGGGSAFIQFRRVGDNIIAGVC
jgi:hypothetical protein